MHLVGALPVAVAPDEQPERRGGSASSTSTRPCVVTGDVDFAHVWMNAATVSKISVSTRRLFCRSP